jgi:hypothetical protein
MKFHRNTGGNATTNSLWALAIVAAAGVTIGGALWLGEPNTQVRAASSADVTVYKNRYCGCCHKWVEHLRVSGLTVDVHDVDSTSSVRSMLGVPDTMASCHTAVAGEYWVEGHVPADLVKQLLAEKPADIAGIAVPGMPIGSPGMEGHNPVTYEVVALKTDGSPEVYATREGKMTPGH